MWELGVSATSELPQGRARGTGGSRPQTPSSPMVFGEKFCFKGKTWGEGCRRGTFFGLAGGGAGRVPLQELQLLSLKLLSSPWVGALGPAEKLKGVFENSLSRT